MLFGPVWSFSIFFGVVDGSSVCFNVGYAMLVLLLSKWIISSLITSSTMCNVLFAKSILSSLLSSLPVIYRDK